jgi:hypothetical protein
MRDKGVVILNRSWVLPARMLVAEEHAGIDQKGDRKIGGATSK